MWVTAAFGIWAALLVECYGHVVGDDGLQGRLVYPTIFQGRSEGAPRVLKVSDGLEYSLTKSEKVFGDSIIVRTFKENGGDMEEHRLDTAEFENLLYQDEDKMAAVSVKEHEGLQVEGVLGLGLRIRPMPEMERSDEGHVAHLVYEVDEGDSSDTHAIRQSIRHVQVNERQDSSSQTAHSAQVSERAYKRWTIYPEVYIISDSTHASYFKGHDKKKSAAEYYGIFLNAVNLRYKSVSNPRVWIRVMGITLNSKEEDNKYIYPIPKDASYPIWGVESLYNLTYHIARQKLYGEYDIVYLNIGLDLLGYERDGRPQNYKGFAFEGTACEYYKTGIGEDWYARFMGVHVVAHELAHSLGCPHDGQASSVSGGIGSQHCPWDDGYIMSYLDTGLNHFKFSKCCNDMINFIAKRNPCLDQLNVPQTNRVRHHKFPGQVVNMTTQCQWWHPNVPETYAMTEYAMGICKVKCYMPKQYMGWEAYKVLDVLDGTPCISKEENSACYNGLCKPIINIKKS